MTFVIFYACFLWICSGMSLVERLQVYITIHSWKLITCLVRNCYIICSVCVCVASIYNNIIIIDLLDMLQINFLCFNRCLSFSHRICINETVQCYSIRWMLYSHHYVIVLRAVCAVAAWCCCCCVWFFDVALSYYL